MSIEPKMEDLLASIRKAIDSDEDGQGASTAGEARGTLMRGALRELRVNLNESKARNKEAREEIAELRGRILRNAAEAPPMPTPPRRMARPLVEPQRVPPPPRNDFKTIMTSPTAPARHHLQAGPGPGEPPRPLPQERRLAPQRALPPPEVPAPAMRARTLQDEFDDITYGDEASHAEEQAFAPPYEEEHVYGAHGYEAHVSTPHESPRGYYQQQQAQPAMLSHHAEATTQAAFRHLSEALFSQGMGGRSLEDVTRELLRGMLKQWLDDNLPPLVERLVREEIARVARNGR